MKPKKKDANDAKARGTGREIKKAMTENNVKGLAMMGKKKKK